MNVDSFLDKNTLVYAATCDESEKAKRDRALKLEEGKIFYEKDLQFAIG